MNSKTLSRRNLLKGAALSAGVAVLAACQPKVIEVTKIVEKVVKETVMVAGTPKVVEKVVKQTVVVKEEVEKVVEKEVEKIVKQTVIVEKIRDTTLIRWHHRLGGWKIYDDRMAAFEEANPGVKVNEEEFPAGSAEYGPKIASLVAAGMVGDLTWTAIGSGSWQFLAANGALAPIDDLVEADSSGFSLDEYWPNTLQGFRLGPGGQGSGELMGLPELAHPNAAYIWMNKTMFEKKGLKPPTDDTTYDELLELAMKMREGDVYGYRPSPGDYSCIRNLSLPFGSELISVDGKKSLMEEDGVKEGLRWCYDLFWKHKVAPTAAELTGGLNQMFLANRLAMFVSGGWTLSTRNLVKDAFEFDMCYKPVGPGGTRGGHLHVDAEAVTQLSKNKKLAYELSKYLTDKEGAVGIALEIGLACRQDAYDDPRVKADPAVVRVGDLIGQSEPHHGPYNLRKQESQTIVKALMDPLWTGDVEPDDAFFAEVSKEFQDFLDKSKEGIK